VTIQPGTAQPPVTRAQTMLFTPGARLGWTFRDHRSLIVPYPEPPPDPAIIREHTAAQLAAAQRSWQLAQTWAARPSLIGAIALVTLGGCAHAVSTATPFLPIVLAAVVLSAPGLAWSAWRYTQLTQARTASPDQLYQIAYQQWAQRAADWDHAELTRLGGTPEWGSVIPPARRIDVFGGTPAGWASLLTVHGASLMATSPLLVADLTGQHAAGALAALMRDVGGPTAVYLLPRDLDRCGLMSGLSPRQLASALAEAIHAGTPGGARTDRALDVRVLEHLASALTGHGITIPRLAAAVQAALDHPVPGGLLTAHEADMIRGPLFGEDYRPQISANLVRLDAFLSGLAGDTATGPPGPPPPVWCTILALEPAASSARTELTGTLVIQWLTMQVTAATGQVPAVIIAAADQITRDHLEQLSAACERRGVPLTLLFRHLRDDATALIGGGATAFMRLGNHHEAEQAAAFIGRHHRFVLSGWTATRGSDHTTTRGTSESWGTSQSRGTSTTSGWNEDHLFNRGTSGSSTRSREHGQNYNHGTEQSQSDGTSWSAARNTARVYEYTVEPAVLQSLPDHALLLANRPNGTTLQPIECHPAIISLPHASTAPLGPP
jgi:hypothetical protein